MVFVPMKKESAILSFGSSWSVDHEARRITETLGEMRPTFFMGTLYRTLEAAWDAEGSPTNDIRSYDIATLPEQIRVPIRLPIPGGRSLDERGPPGHAWILHSGDLLARGLRIETCSIVKVGFKKAPCSIEHICDLVASWVIVEGEQKFRVNVDYDHTGRISADGSPMVEVADGSYHDMPTAMVYFSGREATEAADILASQLVEAADWRKHSASLEVEQVEAEAEAA